MLAGLRRLKELKESPLLILLEGIKLVCFFIFYLFIFRMLLMTKEHFLDSEKEDIVAQSPIKKFAVSE